MYNKNTHSNMSVSFFIVFYCVLFFHNYIPFSSQILVAVIVLDMPVVVLGVVAACDTIAAGHMNFALDYCSQQTSPLLSILSIYYMNNSLFPFPHSFKLRFFSYYGNILFSHKISCNRFNDCCCSCNS